MRIPGAGPASLAACLALGCSDGADERVIFELFSFAAPGPLAPPAVTTRDRVVLAAGPGGGAAFLGTVDATGGQPVDALSEVGLATERAPLALGDGDRVVVVSLAGRLAEYRFGAAEPTFLTEALGPTTPLLPVGDGLAVGTSSGRVLRLDGDGGLVYDSPVAGAVVGPLATDGTRVGGITDLGGFFVLDGAGNQAFFLQRTPPGRGIAHLDGTWIAADAEGLSLYDSAGQPLAPLVSVPEAAGVVAGGGVALAYGGAGDLVAVTARGDERFRATVGGALAAPPVPLFDGRWGLVLTDGTALTLDPDGAEVARTTLPEPSGPLAAGRGNRAYLSSGDRAIGIDFALLR